MSLLQKLKPEKSGKNTQKFLEDYTNKLENLYHEEHLYPGMAVTLASNLNLFGENMLADFFNNLNYSKGFEVPEDPLLFQEFFSRIVGDKVKYIKIQKPVRVKIGKFVLQYNFIRGFRPKRDARREEVSLDEEIDPKKFNYARTECDSEIFRSDGSEIPNVDFLYNRYPFLNVDFLYNRYPFAPYHFLWVPNRKDLHKQFLDPEIDERIIERAINFVSDEGLGSVRLAYNSLGAHASVNQLHLQGFFLLKDWEPPIESYIRKGGIGGDDFYFKGTRWIPLKDINIELKASIKEMNERYKKGERVSYCFYLTPIGAAFFPRKHQADKDYFENLKKAKFTTGFAFFEMLGEIICPNKEISIFDDPKEIESQIRGLYDSLVLV